MTEYAREVHNFRNESISIDGDIVHVFNSSTAQVEVLVKKDDGRPNTGLVRNSETNS